MLIGGFEVKIVSPEFNGVVFDSPVDEVLGWVVEFTNGIEILVLIGLIDVCVCWLLMRIVDEE